MGIITPIGIVILAMVIMASLQLVPGIFALFYHYALGKFSKKQASILSLYFILGAEVIATCLFLSSFYLTYVFFYGFARPEASILTIVIAVILLVLSFISFFFYFRKGKGTRLFIPYRYAKAIDQNARQIKTRSDAFMLGAVSGTYELAFTLPLYVLTAIEIMEMNISYHFNNILTVLYIVAPIIPLLFIRWRFQAGYNLADFIRGRTRDKFFTRFIIAFCYLVIAIIIICFRVNN